MKPDYYAILGVSPDATAEQIKAAYRRRALELHPDRSGQSGDAFIAVQEAYATLSDPERRRAYDRQLQQQNRPWLDDVPEFQPDWFEPAEAVFDEWFGSWFDFWDPNRPWEPCAEQGLLEVVLSPAEARRGGCLRVDLPLQQPCPSCGSVGYRRGYLCSQCRGSGTLKIQYGLQLEYPAGIMDGELVRLSLHGPGGANFDITVRYRVSATAEAASN